MFLSTLTFYLPLVLSTVSAEPCRSVVSLTDPFELLLERMLATIPKPLEMVRCVMPSNGVENSNDQSKPGKPLVPPGDLQRGTTYAGVS